VHDGRPLHPDGPTPAPGIGLVEFSGDLLAG
jgi:hypothetical protein